MASLYDLFYTHNAKLIHIGINLQGPVRFDDKGVREATDLRVLQYRATYINGTPFRNDYEMSGGNNSSSPAGLHQRIRLVDVAFVSENGGRLEFRNNNTKDDIWPGRFGL